MHEFNLDSIRTSYLDDMEDSLNALEDLILSLVDEKNWSTCQRQIMRTLHSIKGTAGSYGLDFLSILAHRLEDQVIALNLTNGGSEALIDILLRGNDLLKKVTRAYAANDDVGISEIISDLGLYSKSPKQAQTRTTETKESTHRVLLVESIETIANGCIRELTSINLEVNCTKNGYEALGRLLSEQFDSIISSGQVPLIDALLLKKILGQLKSPNDSIPFIVLSSNKFDENSNTDKRITFVEKNATMFSELNKLYSSILKNRRATPKIESKKISTRPITILAVDDASDIHLLLDLTFKKRPFVKIIHAEKSNEALNIAADLKVDLVLLDVNMPDISGPELMKKMQKMERWKNCPFYFLTATEDSAEIQNLLGFGAKKVFKKPFSPKTFAEQLLVAHEAKN